MRRRDSATRRYKHARIYACSSHYGSSPLPAYCCGGVLHTSGRMPTWKINSASVLAFFMNVVRQQKQLHPATINQPGHKYKYRCELNMDNQWFLSFRPEWCVYYSTATRRCKHSEIYACGSCGGSSPPPAASLQLWREKTSLLAEADQ